MGYPSAGARLGAGETAEKGQHLLNTTVSRFKLSHSVYAILGAFGLIALALLALGRRDYPNLHTILDTGMCLLSAVLALLLWDIGARTQRPFARWLAVTFAVCSLSELTHALVTVEWFGLLAPIAREQSVLRPATWPIASYARPIGIAWSLWLLLHGRHRAPSLPPVMLILSAALLPVFYWLPRYTAPGWLGITRPWLIGVPLLWIGVGWTCWRHRTIDRLVPMLALMAAVLTLAHVSMLYSRAPHDTQAMVAHLGKVTAFLVLLLSLMRMAAADMLERIRAEQALAQLNSELERRITERTRELQVSYERTRAVISTALDAVIIMDHDGRIQEFNPAAEEIFGHRRGDVIGQHLAETIIPPALRESHRLGLSRYLISGKDSVLGRRIELPGARADGTEVPLEVSIHRMPGDGPPVFAGFLRDLTQRTQEEVRRVEFAAIVESSDDAIVSKNLQGIITAWNRGAEQLFGYAAQEAIGRPMLMLFPPDRVPEEADILARLSQGQSIDHFETVRVTKDGSHIDVSVTISPVRNARGDVVGASKIARDITERKRAQAKLQMQLARLGLLSQITRAIGQRQDLSSILQVVVRSLEDNLPIDFGCICFYDSTAETLTVANVGVRSAGLAIDLGMPERQHIAIDQNGLSRCVRGQLVHEPDLEQVPFPFPQRLLRGGLHTLVAAPLLVESKVFGVLIAARREPNSFSSGECEFLRQLSEHVALASHQAETHAALQRAYEDLRQTQQAVMQQERLRALGQMASGIAHDINNAISPVALYTESLLEREQGLSAAGRGYLQIIQRAIDDVAQTVARMREFYRHREPQLVLLPVQLNPLLQQVIELTRARWSDMPQQRGIVLDLRQTLTTDLPALMGVESEIREALINLIFNAVDAMPEGGVLRLGTGVVTDEPGVYVEVADSGVGMDEDTRRRCMEPFYTTKGERGTGLGLAMVYGVAQRHSADIEIESAPGKGTTVRLTFPLRSTTVPDTVATPSSFGVAPRLRILVVDDDPLLLKSVGDALEGDGHSVTAASGGQAGIDAFATALQGGRAYEVVITDLGMPYVDGRKVASSIKSLCASTPVILLTGWGQRLLADDDAPEHVDCVLSKPPKMRQLREVLAQCCASAQR